MCTGFRFGFRLAILANMLLFSLTACAGVFATPEPTPTPTPTIVLSPTPFPTPTPTPVGPLRLSEYVLAMARPGETTRDEFEAIFGAPYDELSAPDYTGADRFNRVITHYFYDLPDDLVAELDLGELNSFIGVIYTTSPPTNYVEEIVIEYLPNVLSEYYVHRFIAFYGNPKMVHVTGCGNPASCLTILAYPSRGFHLNLNWGEYEIRQEQQIPGYVEVLGMVIFGPMSPDEYRAEMFEWSSTELSWDDLWEGEQ